MSRKEPSGREALVRSYGRCDARCIRSGPSVDRAPDEDLNNSLGIRPSTRRPSQPGCRAMDPHERLCEQVLQEGIQDRLATGSQRFQTRGMTDECCGLIPSTRRFDLTIVASRRDGSERASTSRERRQTAGGDATHGAHRTSSTLLPRRAREGRHLRRGSRAEPLRARSAGPFEAALGE